MHFVWVASGDGIFWPARVHVSCERERPVGSILSKCLTRPARILPRRPATKGQRLMSSSWERPARGE